MGSAARANFATASVPTTPRRVDRTRTAARKKSLSIQQTTGASGNSIAGFPRSKPPGELIVIAIESSTGTSAAPRTPHRKAAHDDSRRWTRSQLPSASGPRTNSPVRSITASVSHPWTSIAKADLRQGERDPLLKAVERTVTRARGRRDRPHLHPLVTRGSCLSAVLRWTDSGFRRALARRSDGGDRRNRERRVRPLRDLPRECPV